MKIKYNEKGHNLLLIDSVNRVFFKNSDIKKIENFLLKNILEEPNNKYDVIYNENDNSIIKINLDGEFYDAEVIDDLCEKYITTKIELIKNTLINNHELTPTEINKYDLIELVELIEEEKQEEKKQEENNNNNNNNIIIDIKLNPNNYNEVIINNSLIFTKKEAIKNIKEIIKNSDEQKKIIKQIKKCFNNNKNNSLERKI